MVGILLLILKWLGIFLLCLLLLILFFLLLLLFLPFCYSLEGRKDKEGSVGKAKLSWGLFLFKAMVSYDKESALSYRVRLVGVDILSLFGEKKRGKKKSSLKAKKKRENKEAKKYIAGDLETLDRNLVLDKIEKNNSQEEGRELPLQILSKDEKKEESKKEINIKKTKKKEPFFDKIKNVWGKIKSFLQKLKDKKESIEEKIKRLIEKVNEIKEAVNSDEFNRAWLLIKKELFVVLKHIRPKRVKGCLVFGMENPADTGQILGLLAVFYPYYQKGLSIYPDFDKKILEGEIFLKGSIQVYKLLLVAWHLYRCKELHYLINRYGGR